MEREHTEEEAQRLLAKSAAKQAARPIKAKYTFATLGSKTRLGGEVATANTGGLKIDSHPIACVGDVIRYPDGTESKIVSGAGIALVLGNQPAAIIGSATDNGDNIVNSLQNVVKIWEFADGDGIPGLLQPGYVVPADNGTQASGDELRKPGFAVLVEEPEDRAVLV